MQFYKFPQRSISRVRTGCISGMKFLTPGIFIPRVVGPCREGGCSREKEAAKTFFLPPVLLVHLCQWKMMKEGMIFFLLQEMQETATVLVSVDHWMHSSGCGAYIKT